MSRTKNIGSELVASLCEYLTLRGHFFWRNNSGAIKTASGGFYRFGTPGSPDIILIGRDGVFVGIEAKAGSGKLSPAQKEFQQKTIEHGGEYIVAHSLDDLIRAGF